jgi:NAD(P)-dependent dehydrogenase (short-subunit alcohol dehydrogenase family)
MARALAEAGARVALVDRDVAGCEALAGEPGFEASAAFCADLTQPDEVVALAAAIEAHFGRVDVLVNNAGIGVFTPFEERTEDEFEAVLDINVKAGWRCIQAFRAALESARGNVINIGSVYGVVSPDPRVYGDSGRNSGEVYGASKAAMIQMTRYFAVHLAPVQIRVNSITPGGVFAGQDPAFVEAYEARTPMGRMGRPEDLAGAVVYLASDAAGYVTGHNLVVDGGFTAW